MSLLREALIEAMDEGRNRGRRNQGQDRRCECRHYRPFGNDLLAQLPKMPRAGRTITKNLRITVTPMAAVEAVREGSGHGGPLS